MMGIESPGGRSVTPLMSVLNPRLTACDGSMVNETAKQDVLVAVIQCWTGIPAVTEPNSKRYSGSNGLPYNNNISHCHANYINLQRENKLFCYR